MNDVAARYRRLAAGFTTPVAGIADDRSAGPSPCEEWTARDALRFPGTCGPAVEPPPGAGEQQRLLAYLGRRP